VTGGPVTAAKRVEATALAWWTHAQAQTTRYERRGALIVASMLLAREVVAILTERGVVLHVGATVTDPGRPHLVTTPDSGGIDSVLSVTGHLGDQPVVVPICPADLVRVYRQTDTGDPGHLLAQQAVAMSEIQDVGPWATPEAIAEALYTALRAP
jgi:hypothetical protein